MVRDRKLVVGKSEYTLRHAGWIYRFASLESSDRFRQEPDGYVPARNGMCAVNQMDHGMAREGNPQWGGAYWYHSFLSPASKIGDDSSKIPMLRDGGVAEQGFSAHCIRESGLLVRGDQAHEIARLGWRYWFPDASHREAFLASLR